MTTDNQQAAEIERAWCSLEVGWQMQAMALDRAGLEAANARIKAATAQLNEFGIYPPIRIASKIPLYSKYLEAQAHTKWCNGMRDDAIRKEAELKRLCLEAGLLEDDSQYCPLCLPELKRGKRHKGEHKPE